MSDFKIFINKAHGTPEIYIMEECPRCHFPHGKKDMRCETCKHYEAAYSECGQGVEQSCGDVHPDFYCAYWDAKTDT